MKAGRAIRKRRTEAGIALLIAIFVLLLISVVAIALIVSSGTESSLAGNYRSATGVYYAALAGLEEARGRLLAKNPNSFQSTAPRFLPPPGTPFAVGSPVYVINPLPGENVAPWDSSSAYPDNEFNSEFASGGFVLPNPSPSTNSVSTVAGVQGPLYKWVRINAVSEQSLNLDVQPYDGNLDKTTPVFYDGTNLNTSNSGAQVLEITSLAALPNGSQKLLQYLVASPPLNLSFPSALTLDGNNVQFSTTPSADFWVKGIDQGSVGSCNPGPSVVTAVGYTNNSDSSQSTIISAIPTSPPLLPGQDRTAQYTNGVSPTPNVSLVALSANLQTVAGLNALVQTIEHNADVRISGPVTLSDSNNIMPSGMSATNPMTVVVDGDLTINGWRNTGYGLLLVTGKLTCDPDASWNGIVLVIGQGVLYAHQGGNGRFQGAVFLAQTVDPSGNPLSLLGSPFFDFTPSSGGVGIYYSSCWIQAAMPAPAYRILSFHEIPQP